MSDKPKCPTCIYFEPAPGEGRDFAGWCCRTQPASAMSMVEEIDWCGQHDQFTIWRAEKIAASMKETNMMLDSCQAFYVNPAD